MGKEFSDTASNSRLINGNINKLGFIKIGSFVLQRTPSRKQKRQLVEKWEEIFANHTFDKGPLPRIYKELKKKKKKKKTNCLSKSG